MIDKILADLNANEGVTGSLVAGKDGLVVAQKAPSGIDAELASAMAATLFGTGERAAKEMRQGEVNQAMVESSGGKILLIAGKEVILAVFTAPTVNLGWIRIVMRRALKEIEESL